MGVLKQDIVLAFHEPEIRELTNFGVGSAVSIKLIFFLDNISTSNVNLTC